MTKSSPVLAACVFAFAACGGSPDLQPLCAAVNARNVDEVKRILAKNTIDLNADQHAVGLRCRPFPEALERVLYDVKSETRGVEIVRLMLDHGADPNSCWYQGSTKTGGSRQSLDICVAQYAMQSKSAELLNLVTERGATLKGPGTGALIVAVREGNLDVVRSLVDAGAPVSTALGEAVRAFRFDIVQYLDGRPGAREFKAPQASSFADSAFSKVVDGHVQGGLTASEQAFMTAARRGATGAVMSELGKGVKADRLDDYSLSALMRAAAWGHVETVNALLKAGADPNLMNNRKTALHLAAEFGRIDVIRALGARKAQLNLRASERDPTPLFAAVKAGQTGAVGALLELGADSNAGTSSETALEYAIWTRNAAVVRELVKGGRTPVNVRHPSAKESPMHRAIRCGEPDNGLQMMKTLIAAGADLAATDKDGNTPLQMLEKKRAAEKLPSYLPCYDAELAVLRSAGH